MIEEMDIDAPSVVKLKKYEEKKLFTAQAFVHYSECNYRYNPWLWRVSIELKLGL